MREAGGGGEAVAGPGITPVSREVPSSGEPALPVKSGQGQHPTRPGTQILFVERLE